MNTNYVTTSRPMPSGRPGPGEMIADVDLGRGLRLRTLTRHDVALVVEATGTETARSLWGRTRPGPTRLGTRTPPWTTGIRPREIRRPTGSSCTTACSVPWG